jgi:hypothetical protein
MIEIAIFIFILSSIILFLAPFIILTAIIIEVLKNLKKVSVKLHQMVNKLYGRIRRFVISVN